MSRQRPSGFSILELCAVLAVAAVLLAVAVPSLMKARRTADLGTATATVRTQLQTLVTRAASRSEDVSFDVGDVIHTDGVLVDFKGIAPPDGTVAAATVVFAAGTGYPAVDGARRSVAIVLSDGTSHEGATAVVVGSSGTIRAYRLSESGWEEQR